MGERKVRQLFQIVCTLWRSLIRKVLKVSKSNKAGCSARHNGRSFNFLSNDFLRRSGQAERSRGGYA
jgi:hypothetical protein